MHSPLKPHLDVVYRNLRYLKSEPGEGLLYTKHDNLDVIVFRDVDWIGSKDDMRATTGYCTLVGGNLLTWKNKRQHVVARASV